jgi:hypothetical protein
MTTETTATDRMAELKQRMPLRTYEVTFVGGRRQRLQATQVNMPRREALARNTGMVEFYAPIDPEGDTGWCGRLVLAAHLGTVIVQIRDLEADIAEVWTAEVKVVKPSFGSRLLDALMWRR